MSNEAAILAYLNLPKYEAVRDALRALNLKWMQESLAGYLERVEKLTSEDLVKLDDYRNRCSFPTVGFAGFFLVKGAKDSIRIKMNEKFHGILSKGYYAFKRDLILAHKAEYVLDEASIQRHSDDQWEQHKAFYAARVGEKITELLEGDATIVLDLSLDCALVGHVTALLGSKRLVLRTSLKTNYRYGENAANKQLTVYRQVPTLISAAHGFDPVARQQEIDRAASQTKADRKTVLENLQKEIRVLERRKRRWDDLYHTLSFCAKQSGGVPTNGNLTSAQEDSKELNLSEIPTLAVAKAAVKETRESLKVAKEKLKIARTTK